MTKTFFEAAVIFLSTDLILTTTNENRVYQDLIKVTQIGILLEGTGETAKKSEFDVSKSKLH